MTVTVRHDKRRLPNWAARIGMLVAISLTAYALLTYFVLPKLWSHYEHQPGLEGRPFVTTTAQGIPGDAMNVGLVGNKSEVIKAFILAGWNPADAITLRTSIEITGSVLLHRLYPRAPVSNLFYEGRRQVVAFEKSVGGSARRRHHIRLWMILENGLEQRPVWLGSASYDRAIGFSHYTGQITHHIAADIDAERDLVIQQLALAGVLSQVYQVSGVGPTINGRNGGGDRYFTDGEIAVGVIRQDAAPQSGRPEVLPSPAPTQLKTSIWSAVKGALKTLE
jgi:LssY C-terminus